MKKRLLLSLLLVGAAGLPGAAFAGAAYTSDKISVVEQPRNQANEIVGLLPAGVAVDIDRCNVEGDWCRVKDDNVIGWVPASYLIGAAAKADASPLSTLTQQDADPHGHKQPGGGLFGF